MRDARPCILGISFDGVSISGVVNELATLTRLFNQRGFRVLVDLGFDITMANVRDIAVGCLPPWAETLSCIAGELPTSYSKITIEEAAALVRSGTPVTKVPKLERLSADLAECLLDTFHREDVRFLAVENGTLPDNPIFTEALYLAINQYGSERDLGKFVLWRDHDLMWSTEPHRYGSYPYSGVRKPTNNPYIRYAVLTEWMRLRMRAWAPDCDYSVFPNRFEILPQDKDIHRSFRSRYSIPSDALLIARCSRIIPPKCIERDLRLLRSIQDQLEALGDARKIYLFVTGPISEDPLEFQRLRAIEGALALDGQVIWGNGLYPFNSSLAAGQNSEGKPSIRDLLEESDLCSFLTSYDYEGFGNPPGEAMASGVPFIATTYQLYEEVYGGKGAVAPLLPIDRSSLPTDPLPQPFLSWTLRALIDQEYRRQIRDRNREVCQRFYSLSSLKQQVEELFAPEVLNPDNPL